VLQRAVVAPSNSALGRIAGLPKQGVVIMAAKKKAKKKAAKKTARRAAGRGKGTSS
jgi:hypothetical protein